MSENAFDAKTTNTRMNTNNGMSMLGYTRVQFCTVHILYLQGFYNYFKKDLYAKQIDSWKQILIKILKGIFQ